ncbi:hypothetical protein EAE32_08260 [Kocuria tytonicola]|uniref:DUF4192 family protein n=1 Tax=Kocuria tytonicola TaxID=2055946 RepID=A0A3L9L8N1_9MICC|nr:DUF4192 family protein [Kocuria tytonicola]RLY95075.1 hypothetical protein EAE32_08260 [Kocuria tytonicola]
MTVTPDSRPTLRVRDAADLLALIPHLVGHAPRNTSVLFFPTADGRALCVSMDTPTPEMDLGAVLDDLLEATLRVPHCGDVVVVVYSDHEPAADVPCASGAPELWETLVEHLGLDALRILVVGSTHWWDSAEPERGVPVDAIRDSPVNAELVAGGSAVEPVALRDEPRWRARLEERGARLLRGRGTPTPRDGERPVGGSRVRAGGHGAPAVGTPSSPPAGWDAWTLAVERVCADREHWVDAVLGLSDAELGDLLVALQDDLLRDALLYAWLSGSPERALTALEGMRAALSRLTDGAGGSAEPEAPVVEEALRCLCALSGEWDGPPHWDSVDGAHRVLQVLDGLLWHARHADAHPAQRRGRGSGHRGMSAAPGGATGTNRGAVRRADPGTATDADVELSAVVAVLAQIEQYRGRARTAVRLLTEHLGDVEVPERGRCAVGDVRRRLLALQVPWWCADPRTSWPGRHAWVRGADD